MRLIRRTNSSGFGSKGLTLVELMIVILMLGLVFPLIAVILGMYKESFYLDDKVRMDAQTSQGIWYLDNQVRIANTFRATVPGEFTDAYGPHNLGIAGAEAWSYKGDSATQRVLITESYSTTTNPLNTGRQPVFEDTVDFDCTTEMHYQPQLTYVSVYFVKDTTLYRRVLTDTTTALCPGNAQQQRQSCPPYIGSQAWDASCQANDEIITTNVSNFTVAYYQETQAGSSTQIDATYSSTDPEILDAADYAIVTIGTSARNGAVTSTFTHRLTKVNL